MGSCTKHEKGRDQGVSKQQSVIVIYSGVENARLLYFKADVVFADLDLLPVKQHYTCIFQVEEDNSD